jgi:CheY-like chemotaxis protein
MSMGIGRHVLLAEDDENDAIFIQRAFKQADVTNVLHIVQDGQMVIDYLSGNGPFSDRGQHPMPSLLMLDLKMPRKTGMEALCWIREQEGFQCLPVIMLSSSVHPLEIAEAYKKRANAFITKPSGTPERAEMARLIKGFWLNFNQLP